MNQYNSQSFSINHINKHTKTATQEKKVNIMGGSPICNVRRLINTIARSSSVRHINKHTKKTTKKTNKYKKNSIHLAGTEVCTVRKSGVNGIKEREAGGSGTHSGCRGRA